MSETERVANGARDGDLPASSPARTQPRYPAWEYGAAFCVLALATALRLWGIRWGLPDTTHLFSYHPDEFHSLRGALALAAGDPNPHFFNYGSLYLYLVALVCLWHDAVLGGADLLGALLKAPTAHVEMAAWVLNARLIVVACAVATVGVAWVAGRRLAGPAGGLIAALLVALLPMHVLHSHYATVDVPQALFVALCLLFTLRLAAEPTRRNYLLAGLAAGLAMSVKYNGALVILAPLLAHGLLPGGGLRPGWGRVAGMFGVMALAFFATSPFVLLSWQEAWRDISFELTHMREGEWPIKEVYPNGWLFHLHPALFLALAAVLFSRGELRRRLLPIVVFAFAWWLMIGAAGVRYERYAMPLEPVAALCAAGVWAAMRGRSGLPARCVAAAALALWCLALLLVNVDRLQAFAAGRPSRDAMLSSVRGKVPEGETLAILWEPWFNIAPVDYCNGGQVLRANPLFARFKRPVKPLLVTGIDAERIRRERPRAVLVSDFELDERFAEVSEGHREMRELLWHSGMYHVAARWPPNGHFDLRLTHFWSDVVRSASDSRYPTPTLHLFLRSVDPSGED